jgi:hypothetical protein
MQNRNCTVLTMALLALAVIASPAGAQLAYTPYAFTNFAGLPGVSGTNDGTGSAARFNGPGSVAVDSAGNVYEADFLNHTIRKVTPAGIVTTLAGVAGAAGTNDGSGSAAQFNGPATLDVDSNGNVYVADYNNDTIRKVTPAGIVTTLAGLAGTPGSNDGTGAAARFNNPIGVAVDNATNVYVGDAGNNTIRKITPAGVVTTLAGSPGQQGSANGTGSAARFNNPHHVRTDNAGNVYVADTVNSTIRKITPGGVVTTLAGSPGQPGSADGIGSAARFNEPYGVAVITNGNVYVADTINSTIRRITPAGVVSTLAGLAPLTGSLDGTGSAARFNQPISVAMDSAGNLYVADSQNNRITKGTPLLQFDTGIGLTVSNGNMQMFLIGPTGGNVVVEESASFGAWTPVQTIGLPPFGLGASMPLGTKQFQFFRARLTP